MQWKKLQRISQGGARGLRVIYFIKFSKNLTKVLSKIVSMNIENFNDFEATFMTLFRDKVSKNAPKHEIV